MIRVLKFRAWSITNKRMYDRVLAGPGDPCSIVWSEDDREWKQFDEACGVIMQFTGLVDKNEKEIFEGDIIRVSGEIGSVCYLGSSFIMVTDLLVTLDHIEESYIEIVGNIYEHPDLIKKR